ncbi:MAG: hypothetical protein U1D30_06500 [Planctomycetota bacterium]
MLDEGCMYRMPTGQLFRAEKEMNGYQLLSDVSEKVQGCEISKLDRLKAVIQGTCWVTPDGRIFHISLEDDCIRPFLPIGTPAVTMVAKKKDTGWTTWDLELVPPTIPVDDDAASCGPRFSSP